jgi:energy-coupling factor transporter ATP-binding protein EcfA2
LLDLARVLGWLHGNRLIHRDIKPDNALIDGAGRLVLLDFGLALHLSGHEPTGTISAGTPGYMAPEQISSQAAVNAAADWYAVGAMVYEALTGRLPFAGSVMQVLAAKTSADPAAPSSIAPGTPAAWNELCLKLLAREPASRPDAAGVLRWLGENEETAVQVAAEGEFFGRGPTLRQLLDACECASAGMPAVVELTGPSGFGKSKILDVFARATWHYYPDAVLLRGRCFENESLPFKALDALMDDLSRYLRHLGSRAGRLIVPEIALLARLFPVLQRVDAIAAAMRNQPVRVSNVAELRRQAFHGFASLLKHLASERLVVLCLDDVHWGDTDSAALFQHLFSRRPIPPIALIASYSAGEPAPEFIRLWRGYLAAAPYPIRVTSVPVGPLDADSAGQLARALLARHGIADEEAASFLAAQSGGNPLLLEELAADLKRGQHSGANRGRLTLAELLQDRISRLSNATREFLKLLAAVGEPLPEDVLVRRLPSQAEGSGVVSNLVSEHLVRRRSSGGLQELEIQHSRIREAILENLPEAERRAAHVRIAEALIASDRADLGMIAIQFARGGDTVRAAEYSEKAAAIGARQDPRITGCVSAVDAMCGWLTGRWDVARDRGKEAEQILRENCAGLWWEWSVARNAWLGGLLWGGEWKEYAVRLAEFSEDAEDRHDLSSLAIYRMNRGPVSLARDDIEQADRDLVEAQRILAGAWSERRFYIPRFFRLFCRAQIAIYSGNRSAAMEILTRDLPAVRRSYLLRVEVIAVFALLLEATLAIACAAGSAARGRTAADLARRARRCAEAIRRKPAIWGSGLAMMIEAGTDAAEGRMEPACARWADAERELTRTGMLMFAAAVRYWRGHAARDRKLLAGSEEFLLNQGVVAAPRLALMLAPGVEYR